MTNPIPRPTRSLWTGLSSKSNDKEFWIQDTGHAHRVSVTNDAENVVAHIHDRGLLKNGRRLFYLDSEGAPAELLHDGQGRFTGFAPYGQGGGR